MAKGTAQHKTPNTNAPTGPALRGKRMKGLPHSSERMADRKVNTKSSDNTPNLKNQNQKRNG